MQGSLAGPLSNASGLAASECPSPHTAYTHARGDTVPFFTSSQTCGAVGATRGTDGAAFLLQDYFVKEFAENLQMHLLVKDVDAWWTQIQAKQISQRYAVRAEPPADRDWKKRDFILFDPAGVLWRVAQDIE
jgi:hypothetical protein